MKDRRSVDDLSIDELQRVLSEKKRAAREARLAQYRATGRALPTMPVGALPEGELTGARSPQPPRPRSRARRLVDALLLIVEIGAVVGLGYVLYNGKTILDNLNREAAQVMAQEVQDVAAVPTPVPTPVITAVVLPSGHTPPTAAGGARFNEAEIPEGRRRRCPPRARPRRAG